MGKYRHRAENRQYVRRLLRKTNLCGICGEPITRMKDATLDHVVPLSKGGVHAPGNMQLAHDHCNTAKGDRLPIGG
jgi:5-methylcytosine-specific restriction endonuclease McrA